MIYEKETEIVEPVKLTDWANEPKVADLRKDLLEAESSHSTAVTKINGYLDNLYVRNNAAPKKVAGHSSVQPKLIRKQAEWRYAALSEPFLSTDDLFNIDPIANDDVEAARQNQLVLNNQINTKINKVKFIGDYIRSAVNTGTVICRTGWLYEDEEYEEEEPVFEYVTSNSPEDAATIQELMAIAQNDPEQFESEVSSEWKEALQLTMQEGVPVIPNQTGTQMVTKTKVLRNHPTVEVCNYKHVIIDPTCKGDIDKASFVIFKYATSISDLKKKKKYKNLEAINQEDTDYLSASDVDFENNTFKFSDKARQQLVCHEYWGFWDIDNNGITKPIVATFVGKVMIGLEENPFPDKALPFVLVPYLPVVDENYGEPDGELLEDNQKIIGAVTRGMIDIMGRSANGQIGYAKGTLDTLNAKLFKAGKDYEFNPGVMPESAFYLHKYPEIPQSAYNIISMQNADAEAITGVKSFHNGISGQALGNTATGVRSALDATSKRDLEILRRLAKGIEDIGRKMVAMNGAWLSDVETVRITNEEFVPVRRDDLAGNFDLKLTISTAEVDNQKAEELAFMIQTLGNTVDFGITKKLLAEAARLRKMPKLAMEIEQYEPQPDPLQVEKAQLENELIKAQIYESQAKAQAALASIGLNESKAQSEQAKAKKYNSEADKTDLDYVEQETGTTHERDKDLMMSERALKTQETLLKEAAKKKQEAKE
jgi:hypothetical protein